MNESDEVEGTGVGSRTSLRVGTRVRDYDFALPEELIAQAPSAVRGSSRMLVLERATGAVRDDWFRALPRLLRAGDLLVLNDSRVLPSRLFGVRAGARTQAGSPQPSGQIEVLLTRERERDCWEALVRPSRKVIVGERLVFRAPGGGEPVLEAEVLETGEFGERVLRLSAIAAGSVLEAIERIGHVPLPPYIQRDDSANDRERYQTVYAGVAGSAAAPTAGLHFTPEVLGELAAGGVEIARVTLHVGLGTFQPVRVEMLDEIKLHRERYTLPTSTADAINRARRERRRVIAAGTTTVRTLEHCALRAEGGELAAGSGETKIFLRPGAEFKVVSGLLTNFHLPQSTLLMLVSAFAGRERVLEAYRHAVQQRYRFFSYGDCMLVL